MFLLAEDKLIPDMHLRQPAVLDKPEFTYSPCRPFTKPIYKENENLSRGLKIYLSKRT